MPTASLDPAAILRALGVTAVTDIAAIDDGADTAMWRVTHGGHLSALRVLRAEQRPTAVREAAAMRAASAGGIPVPMIAREGEWEGRPVFLLEWLSGYTVMAALMTRPWRAGALGLRFGRMQARLHALAAPVALRHDPDGWLRFIEVEETTLVAHLRALPLRTDALLHLDYHPLNVLVGDGQPFDPSRATMYGSHVVGVIDWTNARAGDPRADAAYTATLLHVTQGVFGVPPQRERVMRQAFVRGWRCGYRRQASAGALTDLAPFYAWAGAFITKDVSHRLGQPGAVVTPAYLARLRRWTDRWKARAGIG